MADKWEKRAGETGSAVPAGRISRFLKMGSVGLSVSAGEVARGLARRLLPGERDPEADAAARRRQAEKVVDVLGQLKGASMKIGQILSADPDAVPEEFADVLTRLQRSAPPMPWSVVRRQIETALDRPIEAVFRLFEPEPVGAASIGQVHRAVLHDGREVAVKVQYPGILASLESDLRNLGSLLQLGRTVIEGRRIDEYLAECRKAVLEEADYVAEARNLERFGRHLADRVGVRSPAPVLEWTRPQVLVMEYVHGEKLDVALERLPRGPERAALLERFMATYVWMVHELHEMHSDPHPGNFLLTPDGELVLLDFGCVRALDPEFADGILDLLVTCWEQDDVRMVETYRRLGFGGADPDPALFEAGLLREYHAIVLAPFLHEGPFDFGAWRPRKDIQRFFLRHPRFLKLAPPASLILYLRVLSGIKGLLLKTGARMDLRAMAMEVARVRGRFPGPQGTTSRPG